MRINRRVIYAVILTSSLLFLGKYIFSRKSDYTDLHQRHRPAKDDHREIERLGTHDDQCFYDPSCSPPQILFRIHAETANAPPFACLNDIRLFDGYELKNGVNLVSLNGTTGDVESMVSFDVAESDGNLINWLRSLPPSAIIVGVSFGDVAERVSSDARAALSAFGAVEILKWRGASSYAILGQHGLKQHAHELLVLQSDEHATHLIEGCFDVPLGDVGAVNTSRDLMDIQRIDPEKMAALGGSRNADQSVELGSKWVWCGMETSCAPDEIPMHFFTGESKDDSPRMCVGGYMVFDRDLNNAGRGLNVASIEPKTGRILSVAHFDTYQDDSSTLEEWLENVPLGNIMAVVSFDEASNMLSDMAKRIFYEMGSSMIHRLKFRASWYFVGHKGLAAYSPFEDLNVPTGNSWAKPIKTSICLPKKLDAWRGRAHKGKSAISLMPHNLPRRHFCLKHDGHGEFCDESRIDSLIHPRPLTDPSRERDPVFNMPIVIAAGLSTDALRICLESLMRQEGLNTQMVIVAYDKEYPENAELSTLFHVRSLPVNASDGYGSLILSALSATFAVFPSAAAVAVIEEDVKLAPDWLYYLSQTLPTLLSDTSVDVIHTFNPNGFTDTSGNDSLVYRTGFQPPLFSYVITRKKYEKEIKNKINCCANPGRWLWSSSSSLVPDMSRIDVTHNSLIPHWTNALFTRPRKMSEKSTTLVRNFESESMYDRSISSACMNAPRVPLRHVACGNWQQQIEEISSESNSSSVIVTCGNEVKDLAQASKCFGLYFDEHFVTGVYKRIIRFFADGTNVFIVPEKLIASPSFLKLFGSSFTA
ncbi:unnamed protein product [Cylicocyclus nassatus]|uniref:ILEI/PANDER domain-containing protein n=1 Tax=Cylicocyclus nassatus TaxID=53992 RepID=A0AA36H200_CYLNA|nr:unnamed protein product [Cylicocyclus nassatus]